MRDLVFSQSGPVSTEALIANTLLQDFSIVMELLTGWLAEQSVRINYSCGI